MRFRFVRLKWSAKISEEINASVGEDEKVTAMSSDRDGVYLLVEKKERFKE